MHPHLQPGGVRVRGEQCGGESNIWGIIITTTALEDVFQVVAEKLRVAVVAGVLLLLLVMISKPFQCVTCRTVCGLSVTNTQVKRESYALFKTIGGFSFLSHAGKRAATWQINYAESRIVFKSLF